jgi:hypothetical protein
MSWASSILALKIVDTEGRVSLEHERFLYYVLIVFGSAFGILNFVMDTLYSTLISRASTIYFDAVLCALPVC